MKKIYDINSISSINLSLAMGSLVFLKGDLGAGKTTLAKHIINNLLGVKQDVTSPTYTYYNKYTVNGETSPQPSPLGGEGVANSGKLTTIYHFDLYRLQNYDEFFAIGGEDILDNNNGIILIEWPELIEKYYTPDIEIILKKTDKENEREVEVISI